MWFPVAGSGNWARSPKAATGRGRPGRSSLPPRATTSPRGTPKRVFAY